MKKMKNVYQAASIVLFIILLFFTYLVAEIDDAPGLIFLGTAVSTLFCLLLFGLGELIDLTKKNNEVMKDIYKELKKSK